ncbi:MAG TPA: dihydrofolate reductase [Planctomycetota bacterium]|nr:dihydrofolate reductase [Planctomycetota bacterium]
MSGAPATPEPLYLIVAYDRGRVIGRGLEIPWRKPEDQRHFKTMTLGHALIMGRKNFDSLPIKPLPKRPNIVITRQAGLVIPGAEVVHSLDDAIALARTKGEQPPYVIGGSAIYDEALRRGLITRMYITEIDEIHDGDVFFPAWDAAAWRDVEPPRPSQDGTMRFRVLEPMAR